MSAPIQPEPRRILRTMSPEEPLSRARQLLVGPPSVGCVPITRDGRLVGVITRRDLPTNLTEVWDEASSLPVRDFMTKDRIITIPEGLPPQEIGRLLYKHRIEQVFVVHRDFTLLDVVSWKDLTNARMAAFVVMPFHEPYLAVFEDTLKPVLSVEFGLDVVKADDIFQAIPVIDKIHALIRSASFLVADISERNPNVYYEVGYAIALRKPVLFVTQRKDRVPFDVSHLPYIEYEYTPRGMTSFTSKLRQATTDLIQSIKTESILSKR